MEALHQPGDIIAERYQIIDTLGQGGVGITYAAQDLKNGQKVALKVLSLRQMGDWKVLELFEREAKVLAQLNHPAIPRYLDYFQVDTPEDRAFYIVQQLAPGKSLADLVKSGWRMNESGVRRIATQVLEILVYLHELQPPVVHRDIKPQNLIAGQNAKIFLVDFGAVQDTYRSTFAKGSTIVGTYGYMAPEQFRGQAVPGTDLYGLGATVLFLLTHRSPADLPQERLKIGFRSRIQMSEGFADWLEKMLEPDAEDRFSSAKEALAALRNPMVVVQKSRPSVSGNALGRVVLGVAAVAAIIVLISFKDLIQSFTFTSERQKVAAVFEVFGRSIEVAPPINCHQELLIEKYISQGGNVNVKDSDGKTLLHFAAGKDHKDIVELLLAKGAQVNAKDSLGNTPLHYAALNSHTTSSHTEIAEVLLVGGADVNTKNNKGQTPLALALTRPRAKRYENNVPGVFIKRGVPDYKRYRCKQPSVQAEDNNDVVEVLQRHGGTD